MGPCEYGQLECFSPYKGGVTWPHLWFYFTIGSGVPTLVLFRRMVLYSRYVVSTFTMELVSGCLAKSADRGFAVLPSSTNGWKCVDFGVCPCWPKESSIHPNPFEEERLSDQVKYNHGKFRALPTHENPPGNKALLRFILKHHCPWIIP